METRSLLKGKLLSSAFFERPVLTVAENMLGKVLVRGKISGIITEVEAYDGPKDKACHASKGCTERTRVMFGPAGHWYVYLCYGMYWMLNIVTGDEGYPAAILIRGIAEIPNSKYQIPNIQLNGPGKLTKALGIDKTFNGKVAEEETGLWIEDRGIVVPKKHIEKTPRIGVEYAGEWKDKPYRFILRT